MSELSHVESFEDVPPGPKVAHASLSAAQWTLLPEGTHSVIMFIITVTYCLAVRESGFFRATGLLL